MQTFWFPQCKKGGSVICLLLQQYLVGTDPGTPSPPASDHPPTFFKLRLWKQPLSYPQPPGPGHTGIFELSSLLPINQWTILVELPDLVELFHPSGGCCQSPGQQAPAGLLHLPLFGLLQSNDVAPVGVSQIFPQIV